MIRRLVGLEGPMQRPALRLREKIIGQCDGGCLARDDYRPAKKYRNDEHIRAVGVTMGGLKWMRENGFITEEEYEKSMKYIMERKKLSKHQTSQLKHLSFLVSYHRFKFNEHIRLTTLHQLLCSLLDCVGNYL